MGEFFPTAASQGAGQVDLTFLLVGGICLFVFLAVVVVLTYFCIRYREGSTADRSGEVNSTPYEVAWTLVPTVIFMGIFAVGAIGYHAQGAAPANAMEITVVGKQWMWKIQHPEGPREINELHIPVNQPVKLLMTSEDVIHDFFVPAFRVKFDVLPGRVTSEWFTPTQVGQYHLFCSQYCGFDHAEMGGTVYVMEPAEYASWLTHGASGPYPIPTATL